MDITEQLAALCFRPLLGLQDPGETEKEPLITAESVDEPARVGLVSSAVFTGYLQAGQVCTILAEVRAPSMCNPGAGSQPEY